MGYMGLDSYGDSDEAFSFVAAIEKAIGKLCKKELKNRANSYNTSGWVNIGLFAEIWLKDVSIYTDTDLYHSLVKARDMIKEDIKEIEKTEDWGSKNMHLTAYRRIVKNLNKIIKKAY